MPIPRDFPHIASRFVGAWPCVAACLVHVRRDGRAWPRPIYMARRSSDAERQRFALLDALMLEGGPEVRAGRNEHIVWDLPNLRTIHPIRRTVDAAKADAHDGLDDTPRPIPLFFQPEPPNAPRLPRSICSWPPTHVRTRRAHPPRRPLVQLVMEPVECEIDQSSSGQGGPELLPLFIQVAGTPPGPSSPGPD